MVERLSFTEDAVHEACAELYLNYGTTLAGLVATGHSIDFEDWHREVHGRLPYAELLSRDDALRAMLNSIEAPKWVFTNADQVRRACAPALARFLSQARSRAPLGPGASSGPVGAQACGPHSHALALARL